MVLDPSFLVNCGEAVGTVGAFIVAFRQMNANKRLNEEWRTIDQFVHLRENAMRVDAWIVIESKVSDKASGKASGKSPNRHIVLKNDSPGPIHNVSIEVKWPGQDGKLEQESIPLKGKRLKILPQGTWLIERNEENRYKWEFPKPLSDDQALNYSPQFMSTDHAASCHRLVSVDFTDNRGNEWILKYREDSADLILQKAANPRFRDCEGKPVEELFQGSKKAPWAHTE